MVVTWKDLYDPKIEAYPALVQLLESVAQEEGLECSLHPSPEPFHYYLSRREDYQWILEIKGLDRWDFPWPIYYDPLKDRAIFYLGGNYWSFYPFIRDWEKLVILNFRSWIRGLVRKMIRWKKTARTAKPNFRKFIINQSYMISPNDGPVALSEYRLRHRSGKEEHRNLHPSYLGRIDLVATPEGESVGHSLILAKDAIVSEDGHILAPFEIDGQIRWLSAEESASLTFQASPPKAGSPWSISEGKVVPAQNVQARLVGSPNGIALSLVPFQEHTDLNRLTMASNHLRQVVPPLEPEMPRVRTLFHDAHPELLIGKDLWVGYGSFLGLTYEDAVVISESAARALTVDWVKTIEFRLDRNEIWVRDKSLTIGDYVSPEKPIMYKSRELRGSRLAHILVRTFGKAKDVMVEVFPPPYTWGVVREVWEEEDAVVFELVDRRPLGVGDKIVGRYGNKGIVAAVLPDEEMPRTPWGDRLQVVISPSSVISRMNLGQIYETLVGLVLARAGIYRLHDFAKRYRSLASLRLDTHEPYYVYENFSRSFSLEEWPQILRDLELPEDGLVEVRTSDWKGKMLVGRQHILRLHHFVKDKITSRASHGVRHLDYPSRGRKNRGGQRVGEMEVRGLISHSAFGVLNELPYRCDGEYVGFSYHLVHGSRMDRGLLQRLYRPRSSWEYFRAVLAALGIELLEEEVEE